MNELNKLEAGIGLGCGPESAWGLDRAWGSQFPGLTSFVTFPLLPALKGPKKLCLHIQVLGRSLLRSPPPSLPSAPTCSLTLAPVTVFLSLGWLLSARRLWVDPSLAWLLVPLLVFIPTFYPWDPFVHSTAIGQRYRNRSPALVSRLEP